MKLRSCNFDITTPGSNHKCDVRATRSILAPAKYTTSGVATIDLCEAHYKEFTEWAMSKSYPNKCD